jgi:hypothetical protein
MSICKYYGVEHSASLCMFCNSNLPAQKVLENKIAELEEEIVDEINFPIEDAIHDFTVEILSKLDSQFVQDKERSTEVIKQELAKKVKEQKIKFKEDIKKWFNCETSRLYTNYKYDFLRINDNRIETTQAVQIPLAIGKKLYQLIKENKLSIGDKVLNYSVDQIGKEIKIGCHTFKQSYLLKFGSQLA